MTVVEPALHCRRIWPGLKSPPLHRASVGRRVTCGAGTSVPADLAGAEVPAPHRASVERREQPPRLHLRLSPSVLEHTVLFWSTECSRPTSRATKIVDRHCSAALRRGCPPNRRAAARVGSGCSVHLETLTRQPRGAGGRDYGI